jgi:hypothetical protein
MMECTTSGSITGFRPYTAYANFQITNIQDWELHTAQWQPEQRPARHRLSAAAHTAARSTRACGALKCACSSVGPASTEQCRAGARGGRALAAASSGASSPVVAAMVVVAVRAIARRTCTSS